MFSSASRSRGTRRSPWRRRANSPLSAGVRSPANSSSISCKTSRTARSSRSTATANSPTSAPARTSCALEISGPSNSPMSPARITRATKTTRSSSGSTAPHSRTRLRWRPTSRCSKRPRSATIARSARRWGCSQSTRNMSGPDSRCGCPGARQFLKNSKNSRRRPNSQQATSASRPRTLRGRRCIKQAGTCRITRSPCFRRWCSTRRRIGEHTRPRVSSPAPRRGHLPPPATHAAHCRISSGHGRNTQSPSQPANVVICLPTSVISCSPAFSMVTITANTNSMRHASCPITCTFFLNPK